MTVEALTLGDVGDVLVEAVLPFYKGFADGPSPAPKFRKSLTGEESTNLLNTLHQLITEIKLAERTTAA